MTIDEKYDKKVSVHTWKKYVPEVIEIAKKNGFVYAKPCEKPIKQKYGVFKKYGMCQYEDVGQECFPDLYVVVYFHQHKNVGRLQEIFDLYSNLEGTNWKAHKSLHYKYDKDHIKNVKVEYILPATPIINKYPIYVLSKGRYSDLSFPNATCMTLEEMKLEYTLVLMTDEVEQYKQTLEKYNCKKCINIISIDDNKGLGGTPQRNLAWDDAKKRKFSKHWILDDNIHGYYYFNRRQQIQIKSGVVFRDVENFVDNIHEKVGLAAHSYKFEVRDTEMRNPIILNGKTFSSILVNHSLLDMCNVKWRLKYNEDIDLGLQTLTNGFMTLGFEYFISGKLSTPQNKEGGNREIYLNYEKQGFKNKLECIMKEWGHIDGLIKKTYKKLKTKTGIELREHHDVDWGRFKPKLVSGRDKPIETILTPKKRYTDWEWYGIVERITY